jgi:hypothetical protein
VALVPGTEYCQRDLWHSRVEYRRAARVRLSGRTRARGVSGTPRLELEQFSAQCIGGLNTSGCGKPAARSRSEEHPKVSQPLPLPLPLLLPLPLQVRLTAAHPLL